MTPATAAAPLEQSREEQRNPRCCNGTWCVSATHGAGAMRESMRVPPRNLLKQLCLSQLWLRQQYLLEMTVADRYVLS